MVIITWYLAIGTVFAALIVSVVSRLLGERPKSTDSEDLQDLKLELNEEPTAVLAIFAVACTLLWPIFFITLVTMSPKLWAALALHRSHKRTCKRLGLPKKSQERHFMEERRVAAHEEVFGLVSKGDLAHIETLLQIGDGNRLRFSIVESKAIVVVTLIGSRKDIDFLIDAPNQVRAAKAA